LLVGNDDLSNPNNVFTQKCISVMGEMSQFAKQDGFVVGMAPAESYMDPSTSEFDFNLLHNYSEWTELQPNFNYHGRNIYSLLYHQYKTTNTGEETFDFVSFQLYEGYSHAVYNISVLGTHPSTFLSSFVKRVLEGWNITTYTSSSVNIQIPRTRVVIGLANGWADGSKFLLVWPEELVHGYELLKADSINPRGFMFWNIADEGKIVVDKSGTSRPFWMAKGLNSFLHTRSYHSINLTNNTHW
jgi:hypothetical protein